MALTKETTSLFADLCIGIASFASPAFASLAPVVAPLAAFASMGLHLKDGSAKLASEKAQKAVIKALKGHAEFSDATLIRTASLLKDAKSPLTLSAETLMQAARSGSFEATVIAHLLEPLTLDSDESSVKHILETALHAGLSACRKDESFHQALTQELLIDAAKMANVQLETLDEIKADTSEIKARLDELTLQNGTLAKALDTLESQSKGQLEALASRFEIPRTYDMSTEQLRAELNARAEDYRTYRAEIEAIDERTKGLGNLKTAAREAAERLDFEEVENLLAIVDITETEIAAQTKVLRARNALMRGRAEQAYNILSAAADSFASINLLAPSFKRNEYSKILYDYSLRYGGSALPFSTQLLRDALTSQLKENRLESWAMIQNNLANTLRNHAGRSRGKEQEILLESSVQAYQAALDFFDKSSTPLDWAMIQYNLATALGDQAKHSRGKTSFTLSNQAVTAIRNSLAVYTESQHPEDWAMSHAHLADVLEYHATHFPNETTPELLDHALTSALAALKVFTMEKTPTDWATAKNCLAVILSSKACLPQESGNSQLLTLAEVAYKDSLKVRTKADHPVAWAGTKINLALLELQRIELQQPLDSHPYLVTALAYVEDALTVFDPINVAPSHAQATAMRDHILKALSD